MKTFKSLFRIWHKGHFEKRCQKRTVPTTVHLCTEGPPTSLTGHSFSPHWPDTDLSSGDKDIPATAQPRASIPQGPPSSESWGEPVKNTGFWVPQQPDQIGIFGGIPVHAKFHVCLTNQVFLNEGSCTAWRATVGTRGRTAQSRS